MEFIVHGQAVLISDCDADLVSQFNWYITNYGYARGRLKGIGSTILGPILLHRLVLGLRKGDAGKVDHINGSKLDCRRENLRIVGHSENIHNQGCRSKSGYKGVNCDKYRSGEFIVRQLGRFKNPLTAALCYDALARARFNLPRVNFPRDGELPARQEST